MEIRQTSRFKKDLKRTLKGRKGPDIQSVLKEVILPALLAGEPLDEKYRDHALVGDWIPARECHVFPDTLLVYRIEGDCLVLVRIGSHAELFG